MTVEKNWALESWFDVAVDEEHCGRKSLDNLLAVSCRVSDRMQWYLSLTGVCCYCDLNNTHAVILVKKKTMNKNPEFTKINLIYQMILLKF